MNPDAQEVCDAENVDEDCDGASDDQDTSAVGQSSWYADEDGDGYGDPQLSTSACDEAEGWVEDASDCDDGAVEVNPGAQEVCDSADIDEDCDGDADDDDSSATGQSAWYADEDGDGYGAESFSGCEVPEGAVDQGEDCDDGEAEVHPGADEVCGDGVDNDCVGGDSVCDSPADSGLDSGGGGGKTCATTPGSSLTGLALLLLAVARRRQSKRTPPGPIPNGVSFSVEDHQGLVSESSGHRITGLREPFPSRVHRGLPGA